MAKELKKHQRGSGVRKVQKVNFKGKQLYALTPRKHQSEDSEVEETPYLEKSLTLFKRGWQKGRWK